MSSRVARNRANRVVREQLARERRRRRTMWTSVVAAVALLLAGLVGFAVYRAQQPDGSFATPAGATPDRTGVVVGSGPVTVEVYLDYLCPACQRFEQDAQDDLDRLVAENRIRLVYRPVAILDDASTNSYSTRSAAGAGCAADAGKLTGYTKVLYANQPAEGGPGHTDDELIRLAGTVGLTDPAFGQCVRDGRYTEWVRHVTAAMAPNNVTGTPTVVVAGRRLDRPTGDRLVAAVDAAG